MKPDIIRIISETTIPQDLNNAGRSNIVPPIIEFTRENIVVSELFTLSDIGSTFSSIFTTPIIENINK